MTIDLGIRVSNLYPPYIVHDMFTINPFVAEHVYGFMRTLQV